MKWDKLDKKAEKKPDKKSEKKSDLHQIKAMCGRVYRLRILQGRLAEPETLGRYEREEDELLAKLEKLGVKEEEIEDKALGKLSK